jgi:hypothetical protein
MCYLTFGQPSRQLRAAGVMGINSSYETATAKVAAGARGRTPHTLHFSEIAFYSKDDAVLGIQNGVPDYPETLILKESTANGHNWFKDEWDLAEAGESDYYAMFSPWFEEEEYSKPFLNDGEMEDFEATLGQGTRALPEIGTDEPMLLELIKRKIVEWALEDEEPEPGEEGVHRRALEHLNWRRSAIVNKTKGKVSLFQQEYPSMPEEAFLSTGRRVFDTAHVRRALDACELSDPSVPSAEHTGPARGLLRGTEVRKVRPRRGVEIEIPTGAEWVPWSKRGARRARGVAALRRAGAGAVAGSAGRVEAVRRGGAVSRERRSGVGGGGRFGGRARESRDHGDQSPDARADGVARGAGRRQRSRVADVSRGDVLEPGAGHGRADGRLGAAGAADAGVRLQVPAAV